MHDWSQSHLNTEEEAQYILIGLSIHQEVKGQAGTIIPKKGRVETPTKQSMLFI